MHFGKTSSMSPLLALIAAVLRRQALVAATGSAGVPARSCSPNLHRRASM